MVCSCLSIFVFMLLLNTQEASTLTVQDFFPFGLEHNDTELTPGDDEVKSIPLPIEFPFFGEVYSTLGVSIKSMVV